MVGAMLAKLSTRRYGLPSLPLSSAGAEDRHLNFYNLPDNLGEAWPCSLVAHQQKGLPQRRWNVVNLPRSTSRSSGSVMDAIMPPRL
jgi:hypothetical protein